MSARRSWLARLWRAGPRRPPAIDGSRAPALEGGARAPSVDAVVARGASGPVARAGEPEHVALAVDRASSTLGHWLRQREVDVERREASVATREGAVAVGERARGVAAADAGATEGRARRESDGAEPDACAEDGLAEAARIRSGLREIDSLVATIVARLATLAASGPPAAVPASDAAGTRDATPPTGRDEVGLAPPPIAP